MTDAAISNALSKLDAANDAMTVKRVFGDAYEVDGTTIIPVAAVRGGGGGGGGEGSGPDDEGSGSGAGVGFGIHARPVGAYVVRNGEATWVPTVDVTRLALAGIGLVALLVLGGRRRRRG